MEIISMMKQSIIWLSKNKSVWKENFDSYDTLITRIHCESTAHDAIIRSKYSMIPSQSKIQKTIKYLEDNSFWRSNPFGIIAYDSDLPINHVTSELQKQKIKSLWPEQTKSTLLDVKEERSVSRNRVSKVKSNKKSNKTTSDLAAASKTESTSKTDNQTDNSDTVKEKTRNRKYAVVSTRGIHRKSSRRSTNSTPTIPKQKSLRTYAEAVRGANS